MGDVVNIGRGPIAPVKQVIGEGTGAWWYRLDGGGLAVWTNYWEPHPNPKKRWIRAWGVCEAPIPPWPLDRIPKPWPPPGAPEPTRITMLLDFHGLDGPEVDEALGVHNALDTTVDAWEAGDLVPTELDLRRLGALVGYRPDWFYGEPVTLEHAFICMDGPEGCQIV